MTYVQCRHSSASTAPCRCPVWEAPEDGQSQGIKICDTCSHRAEWHLPVDQSFGGNGDGVGSECCKASWPNDQPCTCPTWIASEDPNQHPGCALCGHKKGWHRPTIANHSSFSSQVSPSEVSKTGTHSRTQSMRETSPFNDNFSHRSYSNQSWTPGSKVSLHSHKHSESSTDPTHSRFASDASIKSPSSTRSANGLLPVVHSPAVILAAEHIRFILSDLDEDEDDGSDSEAGYLKASQLPNMGLSHAEPHIQSVINPSDLYSNPHESSFSLHSYEEKLPKTVSSSNSMLKCSSFTTDRQHSFEPTTSEESVLLSLDARIQSPEFKVKNNHCRSIKSCPGSLDIKANSPYSSNSTSTSFHGLSLDEVNLEENQHNFSHHHQVRPPPTAPLVAQTTSVTFVEELPVDRPKHPSEDQSGRFAFSNSNHALFTKPTEAIKPFQTNNLAVIINEIPVLDSPTSNSVALKPVVINESHLYDSYQSGVKKQKFESFQSNDNAISLLVSPPPSSTVLSPGDFLDITIKFNSSTGNNNNNNINAITSPVEFEQQLTKWKKISFYMVGFVTQNGGRRDSTQHEIFNLSQALDLSDHPHPTSNRTGWQFRLKIADRVNCSCGPGHLPLPSSCSNSVGHASYYLSLVAKKRSGMCLKTRLSSDSKIFADMRLKNSASNLITAPNVIRSLPIWTSLTGGKRVAITQTLLNYHVEFVSINKLNIAYVVVLNLSPDSELLDVNLKALEDLSSKLIVTVTSLNQLISADSKMSPFASSRGDMEHDEGEIIYNTRDVRVKSEPAQSDSTGLIVWKTSGYLQVTFNRSTPRSLSHNSNVDSLRSQSKSHASKMEVAENAKNQWILRASIQSVLLSQPINVCGTLTNLQSTCAARSIMQGMPLVPR